MAVALKKAGSLLDPNLYLSTSFLLRSCSSYSHVSRGIDTEMRSRLEEHFAPTKRAEAIAEMMEKKLEKQQEEVSRRVLEVHTDLDFSLFLSRERKLHSNVRFDLVKLLNEFKMFREKSEKLITEICGEEDKIKTNMSEFTTEVDEEIRVADHICRIGTLLASCTLGQFIGQIIMQVIHSLE